MFKQEKLLKEINRFNINNLPHSILLSGDVGSGKNEMCEYISNKFNLNLIDITDNITLEYLNSIYGTPVLTLYKINLDRLIEKQQNILLKIFEEPSPYSYFILVTTDINNAILTIQTRAYQLKMCHVDKHELLPFITGDKDLTLELCDTLGQVEIANHTDLNSLIKLCDTMLTKMNVAPYYNALYISEKINFSDEYNKFDLYLFCKALGNCLLNNINDTKYSSNIKLYSELLNFERKLNFVSNKKQLFENMITHMWNISREGD